MSTEPPPDARRRPQIAPAFAALPPSMAVGINGVWGDRPASGCEMQPEVVSNGALSRAYSL